MELRPLSAGPLKMMFDPQLAFLRHVTLGDREIIRGIYGAVRDRNWDTIPLAIHDLAIEQADERFAITFLAKHVLDNIAFQWHGEISGSEEGAVRVRFEGEYLSTFQKNRVGLCVLHPSKECSGCECRVEHMDGSVSKGRFPKLISPHQPFKNIRSITHTVGPNVETTVAFSGEAFEMEDQRNWTDASFKTYSTPLDLPFPVTVEAGSRITHDVTVRLIHTDATRPPLPRKTNDKVSVQVDWKASQRLPSVGFGLPPAVRTAPASVVEQLQAAGPDHLRVDLRLDSEHWQERALSAIQLADRLGTKLEVATFTSDPRQPAWRKCLDLFEEQKDKIARWLVFHSTEKATTPELVTNAFESIRKLEPSIPIAVGTDAYFAELNRNRPTVPNDGCVCFSITPQVHAFDELSIRETLEAQPSTVNSAFALFNCPIVVSPVTLRPRFNPNATSATDIERYSEPEVDERQDTGFLAAWTVGVLARLVTHSGVTSMTFFEAFGPRGIVNSNGDTYPVHSVFAALKRHRMTCEKTVDKPLDVSALALASDDGSRSLLLGNMTESRQTVAVQVGLARSTAVTLEAESVLSLADEELR